jgi:uncharacterized protein
MQEPIQPNNEFAPVPSMSEPTSDDKLWALLAYVLSPLVPIILILMEDKKNRPFIKSHAYQAGVSGVALWIVVFIIGLIPVVGCISPLLALAGWVGLIYFGVQAYNGKSVTIPVVTDFCKKQGWA